MKKNRDILGAFLGPMAIGLVLMVSGIAAGSTPATSETPTKGEQQTSPGEATLSRVCSGCHAPEIALGQNLDRQGWKDLVLSMLDRGAVATDTEVDQIVTYLLTAAPASDPAGHPRR